MNNKKPIDRIHTISRHTDKHLGLIMTLLCFFHFCLKLVRVVGQAVQAWECPHTEGRTLPSTLSPCFAKATQSITKILDYWKNFVWAQSAWLDVVSGVQINNPRKSKSNPNPVKIAQIQIRIKSSSRDHSWPIKVWIRIQPKMPGIIRIRIRIQIRIPLVHSPDIWQTSSGLVTHSKKRLVEPSR